MWLTILLATLLFLSAIYLASRSSGNERKLPPGLSGLGVILLIVRLVKNGTHATHRYMIQKYGNISSARIFNIRTLILLGNHSAVKEAYSKPELSDRPSEITNHGLVQPNGRLWKEQRRFALSTLRDFGMGKIAQEQLILHECADLVKEIGKHENYFDPKFYIGCAVTNVICAVIFSDRFRFGDPTLNEFIQLVSDNLTTPIRRLPLILPFIKHLPIVRQHFAQISDNRQAISKIVRKYIAQHQETYIDGNIRDYIDAYIAAMSKEQEMEDTTFTEYQLIASVHDLFVAGSETTGTTLRWALALMAKFPDVQQKVHDEIDNQIGRDRLPQSADKLKMPFTEAVLLEIQRYGTIVPLIAHVANTDTTLGEYLIPKDSVVFVNIMELNRDPDIWPHPHEFNVENFMKNGEIINRNYFMAFSVGKRSCLGESLAKMEMFLFFVSLMQKFKFYFAPGEEPDLKTANEGIVRAPVDYRIRVKDRANL